jgi:hypothetical protein
MHREQVAGMILTYFVLASFLVGYINLTAASGDFVDIGSGAAIPHEVVFSSLGLSPGSTSASQSYTQGTSGFSSNITILSGTWVLTQGVGYVLTGTAFLQPSVVAMMNVQSQNGIYTVNSLVSNPTNQPFYVFARYITGYSGSDIKIVFASDGVHIPKFPLTFGVLDAGDDYFYPLPNAQQTLSGGSTITTILTDTVSSQTSNNPDYSSTLVVQKDGVTLFQITTRSMLPGYTTSAMTKYAAAGSDAVGFAVEGFPNTNVLDTSALVVSGTTGNNILDGIYNAWFSVLGGLSTVGKVMAIFGAALGFAQTAVVPAWLSAILLAPAAAVLILIALSYFPGVGGG